MDKQTFQTFDEFQLHPGVLDGIAAMGYKAPTPIQQQAIPIILSGNDLIACAQTGTGKTAAFVLPILDKILDTPPGDINTLILVPTRELAMQIDQQIEAMSYYVEVSSIAVYGGGSGQNWNQQKNGLMQGADVVIATPGRLIAMIQMGGLNFAGLQHLILDEADRMLDMGFYEDLMRIVSALPKERQTLCFSATMNPKMRKLAAQILNQPQQINIAISKPAEGILQQAYLVFNEQKDNLLLKILKDTNYQRTIIFCSRKETVKKLERELHRRRTNAVAFHSDLEQEEREVIMQDFKNRKIPVLVGTDVLSRGIDVEGIDLVLNYDVPPDPEDYIHRIGRTARAQRTGTAITFINPADVRRFRSIEKLMDRTVEKLSLPAGSGPAPEYTVPKDGPRNQRSRPHRKGNERKGSSKPRPGGNPAV